MPDCLTVERRRPIHLVVLLPGPNPIFVRLLVTERKSSRAKVRQIIMYKDVINVISVYTVFQ